MLTPPSGGTLTYDFLNRVVAMTGGVAYSYDAANRRVWKNNSNGEAYYLYGLDGENLGTYTPVLGGSPAQLSFTLASGQERDYFFGKKLFTTEDNVGSAEGAPGHGPTTFYPYGEQKSGTTSEQYGFATYWEDSESGLDYAMNRYYSSTLGRFLSPDQAQSSMDPKNPQSFNLYPYVQNDPVNFNDSAGQSPIAAFCSVFWSGSANLDSLGGPEGYGLGSPGFWEVGALTCVYVSVPTIQSPFPKCGNDVQSMLFILQNYSAAAAVAAEADRDFAGLNPQNFTAADVLGWAAAESGYAPPVQNGDSGLKSGNLDYFNVTAGPLWINQVPCPAGANRYWACFGSFQGAAEAALLSPTQYGSFQGVANVQAGYVLGQELGSGASLEDAFAAMNKAVHYGTNPNYGKNAANTINYVSTLLSCLQKNYARFF